MIYASLEKARVGTLATIVALAVFVTGVVLAAIRRRMTMVHRVALVVGLVGLVAVVAIHVVVQNMVRPGCTGNIRTRSTPGGAAGGVVWVYWDGPRSRTVDYCVASMRRAAGARTVVVLGPGTVGDYVPRALLDHPCWHQNVALRTDVLRLHLLNTYGGIWVDASTYIKRPFDEWVVPGAFTAFHTPFNSVSVSMPVIETSLMASPPGHPFVRTWLARLLAVVPCDDATRRRESWGVHARNLDPVYHTAYWSALHVLHDAGGVTAFDNMVLLDGHACRYLSFAYFPVHDVVHGSGDVDAWRRNDTTVALKFISADRMALDAMPWKTLAVEHGNGSHITPFTSPWRLTGP